MSEELVRQRTQMGRAVAAMTADGEVRDGWWCVLTGAPAPDANMALVQQADEAALEVVLDRVAARGCPALLMLAGDGEAHAGALPDGWAAVGAMPIMTRGLQGAAGAPDPRVRRAGPGDFDVLADLISEAYGLPRDIVTAMLGFVRDGSPVLSAWLLEDDGAAVSTVITGRVEESVSLWCMATPERVARRGYGRALLGAVLDWAASDGATTGLLGATPAGQPLYEATGWRITEHWHVNTNAASAQFS